ncbi:hypothetical protein XENOCAPTIV_026904, partial [Xenoophorus captivus]
ALPLPVLLLQTACGAGGISDEAGQVPNWKSVEQATLAPKTRRKSRLEPVTYSGDEERVCGAADRFPEGEWLAWSPRTVTAAYSSLQPDESSSPLPVSGIPTE